MTKQLHWRDVLPIHPAADLFPTMSEAELRELGEDIKKNGLASPVVVWSGLLLDGRNRLDAMEAVGLTTVKHGKLCINFHTVWVLADPYSYVISANIHRRHLTAGQKRDLIANVLKARPEQSNNAIAEQVKVDDKTVAKVRTELESTSEIPRLEKTTGKDGKARPVKRPAKAKRPELDINDYGDTCVARQIEADKAEVRRLFANLQAAEAEAGVSESFLDNVTGWLQCIGSHAESHAKLMLDSDWSEVTLADCKAMLKLLDEAQEPIHRIRTKVRRCKDALKTRAILEKSDPDLVAEVDAETAALRAAEQSAADNLDIPPELRRRAAQ